jgi:hypothetical protein
MNQAALCSEAGSDTAKVAGSIVLGIVFGFSLPYRWFNYLPNIMPARSK